MMNAQISIFERTNDVNSPIHVSLQKILKRFKKEDKDGKITTLRDLPNPEEYKAQKNSLPVAVFQGTFSSRNNASLIKASGLMILDFDDKDIKDIHDLKQRLHNDEYIYSYFLSTSGRGYKALVVIPKVKNDQEYKKYYNSFIDRYEELDTVGKDISRCCYFSYDPDLVVKEKYKTWTKKHEGESKVKLNKAKHVYNDYGKMNRILNIIRYAQVGERNIKIYNAAMLAGGYVASGKIEYDEALRLLEQEAEFIAPEERLQNPKTILSGLKNGMDKPLSDLEEIEKKEITEQKFGKIYFTAGDVKDEIYDLYKNGLQKGFSTGHEILDEYYTVRLGSTTYVYAAPYMGKTYFWIDILINLSENHGWKHAVFSPETGRAHEVFAELIAIRAKQDFYNDYKNQMSEEKMEEARKWVDRHFIIIDCDDTKMAVPEFYDVVDIIERVYSTKIQTTTIDTFNEFKHDFKDHNGRQDMYLEDILSFVRQNARNRNRHNCIVTHVQQQQIVKQENSNVRYYPPATYREIAGGEAWGRKGMSMLSVWRPLNEALLDEDGMPYEPNQTIIYVQKAKPKGIGKKGQVNLYYNAKEHRYTDNLLVARSQKPITPADDFPNFDKLK
jgi:hypothetical protein